jgi:two-component system chemotaxis sensor kinase CheA
VIKPLGALFQHLKGVSGAKLLVTGDIALILDVQGLLKIASSPSKTPTRNSQLNQAQNNLFKG